MNSKLQMHFLKSISGIICPRYKCYTKRYLTSKSSEAEKAEGKENDDINHTKYVVVEHLESVTLIGINRPEKKNAINTAAAQQLLDELEKFENDKDSVVGILYGIGGNFSSGYDLEQIAKCSEKHEECFPQFGLLGNKIELVKKPLIATIAGYALGIGFELALMCDLRVMEDNSVLAFANRRFGIPILAGGTVRLPRIVGYSRAMDLILTGRQICTKEALSWGLINKYTETGAGLGCAVNLAKSLVKFPQKTLLADRSSAYYATFSSNQIEEALQFEKDNSFHLLLEEGVKGAKKFVEKGIGKHGKNYNITKPNNTFEELDKDLL